MELEFHPIANCWRLIEGDDFDNLVRDISANGLHNPIVLYEDKILDGRNRYRACELAGVEPYFVAYGSWDDPRIKRLIIEDEHGSTDYKYEIKIGASLDDDDDIDEDAVIYAEYFGPLADPVAFAKSLNDMRRHDTEAQRSMTAAKLSNLPKGSNQHTSMDVSSISQERAAEMMGVSVPSVQRARIVLDKGADELKDAVEHGEVSLRAAADVATLPKPQQVEIVARGEKEILEAAKQIRAERAEVRKAELAIVKERAPSLPTDTYDVIVIDPPWDMQKIERDVRPNQVAFDYPTMSEEELSEFDVPSISADDCHLFCWTTHKFLPSALRLVEAWGFRYVMTMVWHKPGGFQPIGLPQYNCEFALYARKGSPRFVDTKSFFACYEAPRREHSRKPDEFYDVIRRVTDGRRIDVFSRENRDGFEQFGNEADKFSGAA
jgi:N6-adenosine-specific RNA methylase IME4